MRFLYSKKYSYKKAQSPKSETLSGDSSAALLTKKPQDKPAAFE
jgi:hypothetical protein